MVTASQGTKKLSCSLCRFTLSHSQLPAHSRDITLCVAPSEFMEDGLTSTHYHHQGVQPVNSP